MYCRRIIFPLIAVLVLLCSGNLSAQTVTWPREPMQSRVERIAEAAKEKGMFITYENRFLKEIIAEAVTVPSGDIEEWLKLSLRDTPLTYQVISSSRFVIVRRKGINPAIGYLSGKVTDEVGRFLPGATIRVPGEQRGSMAGMNGDYSISLASGRYDVEVRFLGYKTVLVESIDIKENQTTRLDIALKESEVHLEEVVITTRSLENTMAGALRAQRNAPYISTLLSEQEIGYLASSTVQDALKLIPGISVNEKGDMIVRGIKGRSNEIMLDGILLPNYDIMHPLFSFDLIPLSMVENIRLLKSSTPDIPVSFNQSITELTTKDIPDRNFIALQAGYGYHTLTTFNDQRGRKRGKYDFIGFDDGSRERVEETTPFSAEHFHIDNRKADPARQYSFTIGRTRNLDTPGDRVGFIFTLSSQNRQESSVIGHTERGRWISTGRYTGKDKVKNSGYTYGYQSVTGGMLNAGWQFGKNRIILRNIVTQGFENDLTEIFQQAGEVPGNQENPNYQFFNYPTFSSLIQNKLEAKHAIRNGIIQWNASHTLVQRKQKDAAFSELYKPLRDDSLVIFLHEHPELKKQYPASSGWYDNKEQNFRVYLSGRFPFQWNSTNNNLSVGISSNYKQIRYASRELLLMYTNDSGSSHFPSHLNQVFQQNEYIGEVIQSFPFVMLEHRWNQKFRLVWGMQGNHEYKPRDTVAETTAKPGTGIGTNNDTGSRRWYLMPSANLTYSMSDAMNLRANYQHSVARPQPVDYIPYPVYDTYLLGTFVNRPVIPSTIHAFELLLERYINTKDLLSTGLFYRHIHRPFERTTFQYGMDELVYVLQNSDRASSYGFEAEIRKQLDFIAGADFLRNMQVSTGVIFTRSTVEGIRVRPDEESQNSFTETRTVQKRPLSGQTPYLISSGIRYTGETLHVNLFFHRTGRQLFLLGQNAYQNEYRAPYNLLEANVEYQFPGKGISLKISGNNLLNSIQTFYTKTPDDYVRDSYNFPTDKLLPGRSENYVKESDPVVHQIKNGINVNISASYTF